MTVRTRIAPSPTGDPHVGTAYIALFNLCFARQHGGEFILRIEDTDQVRSTDASEQQIMQALKWLGLNWSEGPDVGGEFGPYRQSERSEIYHQHAQQLVEQGNAFPCFCTSERLNELRKTQMANKQKPGYDGCCANLPAAEAASRIAGGESHVIRMRIPIEGVCTFKDMLRGDIEIEWSQVDMQVLMKADGLPTYHLANVVDDHLMQISHVIRGEEWINSAPKHQLLYQYFDWQMPELCHMPLLRNPDKSKLSKRKNPTSIMFYERMGFLPEALLNYLGRMGWSMPEEQEKFTLDDMVAHFDINRVSLGGPIFDMEKLRWLNGAWIREDLTLEQFSQRIQIWALNSNYLMQIAPHVKERVDTFSDLAPLAGFFLSGMPQLDEDSFAHKKVDNETVRRVLQYSQWLLDVQQDWSVDELTAELTELAQKMELKIRDFLFPLFVAIAGNAVSTSVLVSMSILGADMSRARLRSALKVAGGVSKKETKRWQKEYAALSVNKSDADA